MLWDTAQASWVLTVLTSTHTSSITALLPNIIIIIIIIMNIQTGFTIVMIVKIHRASP